MPETTTVDPVHVSIIGSGTGGGTPLTSGTLAETPGMKPNLVVNVVGPFIAILVRFIHVWLVAFAGGLALAGIGVENSAAVAATVTLAVAVKTSAFSALVIAGVETVKNLITIFGGLESKYPLGTGSI